MRKRCLITCGLAAVLAVAAAFGVACGPDAADTGDAAGAKPLLSLLAGIPDDLRMQSDGTEPYAADGASIYFVDYAAMEAAYGATRPADAQHFDDSDGWDEATRAWWVIFFGQSDGLSYSLYWRQFVSAGPETVGFSPLAIDQAMEFGTPPANGLVLSGTFDSEAVSAAYEANFDLASRDIGGTKVWSWGDDPADGMKADVSARALENPFGGQLGRLQPMTISDSQLMSSADLDVVLGHADAEAGKVPNLADSSGYRDAINAVASDAHILQATIVGPAAAQSVGLLEGDGELPFELLVLADTVTDTEQIARVALVFGDTDAAERAASALLEQLATRRSSVVERAFVDLLAERGVTAPRYYVRESSDRAVLVLEFATPKATIGQIATMGLAAPSDGTVTPPGVVYRLFSQMLAQGDMGWLTTAPAGPGD